MSSPLPPHFFLLQKLETKFIFNNVRSGSNSSCKNLSTILTFFLVMEAADPVQGQEEEVKEQ
jgi:hypothetical protein